MKPFHFDSGLYSTVAAFVRSVTAPALIGRGPPSPTVPPDTKITSKDSTDPNLTGVATCYGNCVTNLLTATLSDRAQRQRPADHRTHLLLYGQMRSSGLRQSNHHSEEFQGEIA